MCRQTVLLCRLGSLQALGRKLAQAQNMSLMTDIEPVQLDTEQALAVCKLLLAAAHMCPSRRNLHKQVLLERARHMLLLSDHNVTSYAL